MLALRMKPGCFGVEKKVPHYGSLGENTLGSIKRGKRGEGKVISEGAQDSKWNVIQRFHKLGRKQTAR